MWFIYRVPFSTLLLDNFNINESSCLIFSLPSKWIYLLQWWSVHSRGEKVWQTWRLRWQIRWDWLSWVIEILWSSKTYLLQNFIVQLQAWIFQVITYAFSIVWHRKPALNYIFESAISALLSITRNILI